MKLDDYTGRTEVALSLLMLCVLVGGSMLLGFASGFVVFFFLRALGPGVMLVLMPVWLTFQVVAWNVSGEELRGLLQRPSYPSLIGWVGYYDRWGQIFIRSHLFVIPFTSGLTLFINQLFLIILVGWMLTTFCYWMRVLWRYYKL